MLPQEFHNLSSFQQRRDWLDARFKRLGQGDARIVWALSPTLAIKVSKPTGTDQTRKELRSYKCFGRRFMPEVIEVGTTNSWIVVERAEPFTSLRDLIAAFLDVVGMTMDEWSALLERGSLLSSSLFHALFRNPDPSGDPYLENTATNVRQRLLTQSPWFREFWNKSQDCRLLPADLHEDNWGTGTDGRLVVLDAGSFGAMKEHVTLYEMLFEDEIDEANTLAGGAVVEPGVAPLGTSLPAAGFWRKDAKKKVKTASPALHTEEAQIQAVGTPTDQLHMIQGLYGDEEDTKTKHPLAKR